MALPLRYSTTSQTILLGPFLSDTDGKTPQTALTIANTDIKLNKHNGTTFVNKNSGGATHIANGYYYCTLDNLDTDTLGRLIITVNMTGALPVWHEFEVISQQEFDAKYGSSYAQVNVIQVAGTNQTARDLGAQLDVAVSTRASGADYTSARAAKLDNLDATVSSRSTLTAADVWGYATRTLTSFGTLVSDIWGYTTRTLTSFGTLVSDIWNATTRSLTDKADFALSSASRAAIVDEVWDELRSGHITAGTFGEGVSSVQGNVTGSVGSVVSGVTVSTNNDKTGYGLADGAITSTKFASGAITSSAIAANAIDSSQFTQAAADKVWNTTVRTITGGTITTNNDKTGYSLSSSGIDAIWDQLSVLNLSFETLLARAYEIINNRMTVDETTGAVTLRNLGNTATIATGSVTSSSGATTRAELSWA